MLVVPRVPVVENAAWASLACGSVRVHYLGQQDACI